MKQLLWAFALLLCGLTAIAQPPTSKTFLSKEGRFSVKLPARPKYSTEKPDTGDVAGPNHVFLLDQNEIAYYVSYTDFKPEFIKATATTKLLDGARDGGVGKGKLVSEKNITIDGNPGREIAIDMPGEPKIRARARFYLVNNRLYTIIFAGTPATADGAETDAFLASLKLLKPKTPPDTWMPLTSPEGGFTIKMPGKPESSLENPGKKEVVHLWQFVSEKEEVGYFAAYNELFAPDAQEEEIEKALDSGRDALAKSLSATVEEESLLSVEGNPGREVRMHVGAKDAPGERIVLFRSVIVKGRYYQVMALGTRAGMEKGHIEDFMDSFQLLKSPPGKKGV